MQLFAAFNLVTQVFRRWPKDGAACSLTGVARVLATKAATIAEGDETRRQAPGYAAGYAAGYAGTARFRLRTARC